MSVADKADQAAVPAETPADKLDYALVTAFTGRLDKIMHSMLVKNFDLIERF